jgi:cobaltochelatase CobS
MATIQELENKLASTTNPTVANVLRAEIQKQKLMQNASGGDEIAQMMLVLKDTIDKFKGGSGGGNIQLTDAEIQDMVRQYLQSNKISLNDLSDELRGYLTASFKVSLNITTSMFANVSAGTVSGATYEMPLFQKILSDAVAMNNVYLFGGAGTGKTYIAEELAKFLGYEFILLNCNQYTSPLEILGGQTIDGYQRGKLERAWGNLDVDGEKSKYNGAVLCIDEMPKIDPNTAGLFNDALSRVKNYSIDKNDPTIVIPPTIENGEGKSIPKGNLVIIATGNLKLNEVSTEYEANFKQDLSLQDRFAGSTYEVTVDYEAEWLTTMKGFAFIYIPLIKLREKIEQERWTGFAFVSRRIMVSLKATYLTYRNAKDGTLNASKTVKDALQSPKTLLQGVNSFLNLFKPDQIQKLKDAMQYDEFIKICAVKDTMPIDALDTQAEIDEVNRMIQENKIKISQKIA